MLCSFSIPHSSLSSLSPLLPCHPTQEMSPIIYDSDDYYDDSDGIDGGVSGGQAVLEDSNFCYRPPRQQEEDAGSDISDFWTMPIVDKSGKEIGRRRISSTSWQSKEDKATSVSTSRMKKSGSFLHRLSRLGRHGNDDHDPLLESDELAQSIQLQELHKTSSNVPAYSPSKHDRQRVAADLRQKVESGQAGRDFSRVSIYRPASSSYAAL